MSILNTKHKQIDLCSQLNGSEFLTAVRQITYTDTDVEMHDHRINTQTLARAPTPTVWTCVRACSVCPSNSNEIVEKKRWIVLQPKL